MLRYGYVGGESAVVVAMVEAAVEGTDVGFLVEIYSAQSWNENGACS